MVDQVFLIVEVMRLHGLLLMQTQHKQEAKVEQDMLMEALEVVQDVQIHLTLQAVGLAEAAVLVLMYIQEEQL